MLASGQAVRLSGTASNRLAVMAVTMYPGEMVLTRMPCSPHSEARLRASCRTAALDALYALFFVSPDVHGRQIRQGDHSRANQPPVRHGPTHAANQHQTPLLLPLDHLARDRLRRHEDARHVDPEHLVGVLGRVLERGCL